MKIFSIVGLALAASSLANGLALKGSNAPRLSVQSQEVLTPAGLSDLQQEEPQSPQPYQFSYDAQSEGGLTTRSESGDASGRVIGQYSIKGADGISRIVSYTADSEGFRANITTNEPGTESQNPSFIVLQSSQLPAAEISRQLQTEADLAQEEAPVEEAELPQPAKSLPTVTPRKLSPAKTTTAARRPAQLPLQQQQPLPRQTAAQVSVPTKGRRPAQLTQQQPAPIAAPSKRPTLAASPAKGQAIRSRGPSKSMPLPTTQRPRQLAAVQQPAKRPAQLPQLPAALEQSEDQEPQLAEQAEDAVEDESSEGF